MRKINWKVRLKNKVWLVSFTGIVIAFIYQILAMLGITPAVAEDKVVEIVGMIITLLGVFGVIVDPTTDGLCDSEECLNK